MTDCGNKLDLAGKESKAVTAGEADSKRVQRERRDLFPKFLGRGTLYLGYDVVRASVRAMLSKTNSPIVSVGSGCGFTEKQLSIDLIDADLKTIDMICVDPLPLEPHMHDNGQGGPELECPAAAKGKAWLRPSYDTVDSLVKARPAIVGNCVMMCNWPFGMAHTKYDLEALVLLQPVHALYVIDVADGMSGGYQLHAYLKSLGVQTNCRCDDFASGRDLYSLASIDASSAGGGSEKYPLAQYKVAHQTTRSGLDSVDADMLLSAVLLTRNDSLLDATELNKIPTKIESCFQFTRLTAEQRRDRCVVC